MDVLSTPDDERRMARTGCALAVLALTVALAVVCGAVLAGWSLWQLARRFIE